MLENNENVLCHDEIGRRIMIYKTRRMIVYGVKFVKIGFKM